MFTDQAIGHHTVYRNNYTNWEIDKDFSASDFDPAKGGVCVRVGVLRLEFPKYSYSVGWKYPNGELKFHFQEDHKVDANLVHLLLESAIAHVAAEVKKVTDTRARQEAERQKFIDDDRARKAAKKKKYEANVEERRIENRRRSQGGNGKGNK